MAGLGVERARAQGATPATVLHTGTARAEPGHAGAGPSIPLAGIARVLARANCSYHTLNWAFEPEAHIAPDTPEDEPRRVARTTALLWMYTTVLQIYRTTHPTF